MLPYFISIYIINSYASPEEKREKDKMKNKDIHVLSVHLLIRYEF